MQGEYLGHLSTHDRLYSYLQQEIFSVLGNDCRDGIRVFGTNGSNAVYIYEDRQSNRKVVGKFFYSRNMRDWNSAVHHLDKEWNNIQHARSLLDGSNYVARPLGRNVALNCLLVTEYCYGLPLEDVINRAIETNDSELLHGKLRALAGFLAQLHNRSARMDKVNFYAECDYFERLLAALNDVISMDEISALRALKRSWCCVDMMWQDCEVLLHGDATPANFFFGDGMYVISFDMERMKYGDRVFDLGRIAGELQHFFLRAVGNKFLAEQFISGLFREYCSYFPDRDAAFAAITARVPFYMGMNLLRIARNKYLADRYRRQLISEAILCLQR